MTILGYGKSEQDISLIEYALSLFEGAKTFRITYSEIEQKCKNASLIILIKKKIIVRIIGLKIYDKSFRVTDPVLFLRLVRN